MSIQRQIISAQPWKTQVLEGTAFSSRPVAPGLNILNGFNVEILSIKAGEAYVTGNIIVGCRALRVGCQGKYEGQRSFVDLNLSSNPLMTVNGVSDEIYYDESQGKWKNTRRFNTVDLGSLNWTKYGVGTTHERFVAAAPNDAKRPQLDWYKANIICSGYNSTSFDLIYEHLRNNSVSLASEGISIYDSSKLALTPAQFKDTVKGVKFMYEMQSPVTVILTASPFQKYKVFTGGTEQILSIGETADLKMKAKYTIQ